MPHTSHRKRLSRTKRTHVTDEDGWTRVTSVNPRSRAPQPVSYNDETEKKPFAQISGYAAATPTTGMTIEKLRKRFEEVEQRWLESDSWKTLSAVLEEKVARTVITTVQEATVFGTGSYSGMRDGWIDRSEVSLYQLAAFKAVVDAIERITGCRPSCKAQDPVYNDFDTQLLSVLGIEKVDHPAGFESLSSRSFVFAPGAELLVELYCLEADPAITMLGGKLDHHWRNEKGQACTNRVFYCIDPFNEDCSDSNLTNVPPSLSSQNVLEEQLQILERFLPDKESFSLPDLDVKDFPFNDIHVFSRKAEVGREDGLLRDERPPTWLGDETLFGDYAGQQIASGSKTEAGGIREFEAPVKAGNLDFDARVPIPISVFPSTYRSDATSKQTTVTKVEGEVNVGAQASSRVGREDTRFSGREEVDISVNQQYRPTQEQDIHVYEERTQYPNVDITRERYQGTAPVDYEKDVNVDIHINREGGRTADVAYDRAAIRDTAFQTQLDVTEQDYRRRVNPNYDVEYERTRPVQADISVEKKVTFEEPAKMGYYDDAGQYHSFRRGVQRAYDNVVHPFSHGHHHHHHHGPGPEVVVEDDGPSRVREGNVESVRFVEPRFTGSANTVTIPCHFIRMGDLLILQGRPCQVIRISVSSQTGQYRYLGVDLFTKQLHEESSFVSNPQPSVVVQSMIGPVFKQYRILDLREDGKLVCMTETGDVKQGLSVVDQGGLYSKITRSFDDGRGSVRALVINDGGRELVVDYKVIHGSRL